MKGPFGFYGPNDYGYIHKNIVRAAKEIKHSQMLYSQGHYSHSDARVIPQDHHLRIVMDQLAELDKMYCVWANVEPNQELFSTYEPPYEDTIGHSKYRANE